MPPLFVVLQVLSYTAIGLALVVIPLVGLRAGPIAWRTHASSVALCAIALIVVLGHWVFAGMVPWWRIVAFYLAQFVVPVAVAVLGARAAARRWPTQRWLVASTTVIGVMVVASMIARHTTLIPDLVSAVQ